MNPRNAAQPAADSAEPWAQARLLPTCNKGLQAGSPGATAPPARTRPGLTGLEHRVNTVNVKRVSQM